MARNNKNVFKATFWSDEQMKKVVLLKNGQELKSLFAFHTSFSLLQTALVYKASFSVICLLY